MFGASAILAILFSAPAPAAAPDAAAVEREVAACQQSCAARASETDRASCKLQCESKRRAHRIRSEGVRSETSGTGPRTQRPTTSDPNASRYVTTQPQRPISSPPAGGYTTVIENTKSPGEIAACQLGCDQAGLPATDRASCKLNCAAQTRIVHVVPSQPQPGAGTTTPAPNATPAPAPAPSAASLQACYDSCAPGAGATCRLNCESAHRRRSAAANSPTGAARPGPPPNSSSYVHRPSGDPGAAAACEQECSTRAGLTETDRATCKLGCTRHSNVVVEQWTTTAPKPQAECTNACACASRCGGHQTTCVQSCAGKKGGDAATCKLQCEATFNSCSNACQATGCSCQ